MKKWRGCSGHICPDQVRSASSDEDHSTNVSRSYCFIIVHITPLRTQQEDLMLYTIAVILIILWLLGIVTSYTMNGFIHVLLVIAIITVLLRVIRGENIFKGKM